MLPLHVKVLLAEERMLVGVRLHVRLGGAATARVIVPMKPFCELTMIVTVPEVPLLKLRDATLVSSVTSGMLASRATTVTCTTAVWVCKPDVPVIVTV
jgi:hypothetical protein